MGKRRKKQEGHYVLWGVLILLILSIIAGLIGYFMFSQQKEQIDKTTLCQINMKI